MDRGAIEVEMPKLRSDSRQIYEPAADQAVHARIAFLYLGTGSAFGGFALGLARSLRHLDGIDATFIVASSRPLSSELSELGVKTLGVPAVEGLKPLAFVGNFIRARRLILNFLETHKPDLVVTLMPHVWSPVLAPEIKRRTRAYATIIHDATPHPGDPTGCLTRWLVCDGAFAHRVVVLSRAVEEALSSRQGIRPERMVRLFHPDLGPSGGGTTRSFKSGSALRVLFLGRIMPYKGLPLLVEAVELLRASGVDIALGVAGAGDISELRERLQKLGAKVINRWISDAEISELLAQYDVMACSHVEASQSGVAALAFGHGMPVVATPIGGLVEQVSQGQAGVLAADVTPGAFAEALRQLIATPGLYDRISLHLTSTHQDRSMERFASDLCAACLPK